MLSYIIRWNSGYGDEFTEIETEDENEALNYAYELWRDEVESHASYAVVGLATNELREDYGIPIKNKEEI